MTRIKTIGSGFLLAVVLLNSLLMPGCTRHVFLPLGGEFDGFVLKEEEMENVRFEPQGLPFSIEPARAYWLRRGDEIAPRWDTYEWHWERKGAMQMCGFVDNTSAGDCQVCDFCNPPASSDGPPCLGWNSTNVNFGIGFLEVVADPGFIPTDNPESVRDLKNNIFAGCSNATQGPLGFFAAAASGLYRLRSVFVEGFKRNGPTNGEIKLHVVEEGEDLAQQTAYQLMPQTVDNTNYWTWTIEGSPLWLENFSPNLRVTDIRILRGSCADGSAKGKQCEIPDGSVPVRPSRILFLPDFQGTVSGHGEESQRRCYSAPDPPNDGIDGNFINLFSCRKQCDRDPVNNTCTYTQTERRDATPTYDPIPISTDPDRAKRKQTWLVEFNTLEGADAVSAGDELIIEFTIQVK